LKGVGTEIGGIAAQVAALGRGDFSGFSAISAAMKEDAARARKEFDAYEARLMSAGSAPGTKPTVAETIIKTRAPIFGTDGAKKTTAKTDLEKMLEKGQQNLMDEYYKYSSEEDMQAAIYKNAEKSILVSKKEQEELDKLREKYQQLADPLKKYKDEIEEINRLRAEGVLTAEEAVAAEKNVSDAMKETSERMAGIKDIGKDLGMTFASAFEDAIVGGKKFSEVLKGIGEDILRLIMRKNITEPAAAAISSFNWSSLLPSADGNVFSGAGISAYSGQVVSRPTLFPFASGIGLMGEAGAEAILPLKRGASGKLGVESAIGGVNITINNTAAPNVQATATARRNENGFDVDVLVAQAISKDMSRNGPITQSFAGMFGLQRGV
jgi:hypothetical protein